MNKKRTAMNETLQSLATCLVDNSDFPDRKEMVERARNVLGWAGVITRKLEKDIALEDDEIEYIKNNLR